MNDKPRILCPLQLPPPVYGSNISNQLFAKSPVLNEYFELDVIPISYTSSSDDIGAFSFSKVFRIVKILWQIIKRYKNNYDLIYFVPAVKGVAFIRDYIILMFLKINSAEILIHLRGKGIKKEAETSRFKKYLYKSFFKGTNVICLSELLTYDVEPVYDETPYILNNCMEDLEIPERRNSNKLPVILFLSNFVESKGIFVFIDALNLLKNKGENFKAHLVGASSSNKIKDKINYKIKEYNLTEKLLSVGPKYGKEKKEVLSSSDIFVFPTFYELETWGLVNLEAMQAGLPVISTNEGAIPDIIDDGETGFIVKKKDPEDLANKIQILLNDVDLRVRMGKKGKQKFYSKYTYDAYQVKMKKIINDILNR